MVWLHLQFWRLRLQWITNMRKKVFWIQHLTRKGRCEWWILACFVQSSPIQIRVIYVLSTRWIRIWTWPAKISISSILFVLICSQLQLSPSSAGDVERNCNDDLNVDDEMELTEYYVSAGSQSVDCEASPPALQVEWLGFLGLLRLCCNL